MIRTRLFLVLLAIVTSLIILTGRLFWIQVVDSKHYSSHHINLVEQSISQRAQTITLDDGRGDFYDRHHEKLTGVYIHTLAIFPITEYDKVNQQKWPILTRILGISLQEWEDFISHLSEPVLWKRPDEHAPIPLSSSQIREIQLLQLPFVKVVPYKLRYIKPYTASHIIGFISQNPQLVAEVYDQRLQKGFISPKDKIGAAGLEWAWDRLLQGVEPTTLSLFMDGNQEPLSGLSYRLRTPKNPLYPLKIMTTIDKSIQHEVEHIVDRNNLTDAAVVILDANNADVVAMVSRPHYDPFHVQLEAGNWSNKALKATTPGSIFKTVVAAAALEAGVIHPREKFQCDGELGKYGFSCWKKGGHGEITLEQAFAESCNITFAKVIGRLSSTRLEHVAKQMGFLQQVGHKNQFASEEKGHIFASSTDSNDEGVKVQTAIGQRDVMISPLQAANLIVSLLHDGEVKSTRIVREIRYHNDRLVSTYKPNVLIPKRKGISRRTSRTLLHWMEEVVNEGTGQSLQKATWKLAGKSGTAQVQRGEKSGLNQWFVGYGPVDDPQYAVAVLVQTDDDEAQHRATALFREIMNQLAKHER